MYDKTSVETQYFLSEVLNELQDEVYVYETDSLELLYANKAACLRCDWDQDSFRGLRITDSSSLFNEIAFRAYVRPLLTGAMEVMRIEVVHEKGPVEITTRLSTTPDGRSVFLSVLRDRSEQERIEVAKMESLSEISHELRTPLTSIKGSLRLLETGVLGELPPKSIKMLNIVTRNTDILLSIVTDILDLQKISAGKFECEMRKLDLAGVVAQATEANRGYGTEHSVALVVGPLPDGAFVTGNDRRLMQVMANLISNAIKHSPAQAEVRVAMKESARGWVVSVADSGPGIPEAARKKIFRSFEQAKSEDGKLRGGTGLGLAIARKLVRLHHGTIDFLSEPGQGTVFSFEIPKYAATDTATG